MYVDNNNNNSERDEEKKLQEKKLENKKQLEKKMQYESMKTFEAKLSEKASSDIEAKKMNDARMQGDVKQKGKQESLMSQVLSVAKKQMNQTGDEQSRLIKQKQEHGDQKTQEGFEADDIESSESHDNMRTHSQTSSKQSSSEVSQEGYLRVGEKESHEGGRGFGSGADDQGGDGDQSGQNKAGSDQKDSGRLTSKESKAFRLEGQGLQQNSGGFDQNARSFARQELDEMVSQIQIGLDQDGSEEFAVRLSDEYYDGLVIKATRQDGGVVLTIDCPNPQVRGTFLKYRHHVATHLAKNDIPVKRVDVC